MKKKVFALGLFLLTLIVFSLSGCKMKTEQIILSFDKSTAYFSSEVKLWPIAGDYPAEGDAFEKADIKITATPASKVKLSIDFEAVETTYEGIKIAVNGEVFPFAKDIALYDSVTKIESAELQVQIFLAADAPTALGGRQIAFYFLLQADSE